MGNRISALSYPHYFNSSHRSEYPMNNGLASPLGATPLEIAERSAGNLLPVPWVEADDVANALVFLASDKARFVAGSEFLIDAGLITK